MVTMMVGTEMSEIGVQVSGSSPLFSGQQQRQRNSETTQSFQRIWSVWEISHAFAAGTN